VTRGLVTRGLVTRGLVLSTSSLLVRQGEIDRGADQRTNQRTGLGQRDTRREKSDGKGAGAVSE
jgi:hypothetical protein